VGDLKDFLRKKPKLEFLTFGPLIF